MRAVMDKLTCSSLDSRQNRGHFHALIFRPPRENSIVKKRRRQDWQMWQKAHTGHSNFPSALALRQVTDSVQWSGRLPTEVRVGHVHLKARNDSNGVKEDSSPTVPTIPLPWTVHLTPRGSVSPNSLSVAFFHLSLAGILFSPGPAWVVEGD